MARSAAKRLGDRHNRASATSRRAAPPAPASTSCGEVSDYRDARAHRYAVRRVNASLAVCRTVTPSERPEISAIGLFHRLGLKTQLRTLKLPESCTRSSPFIETVEGSPDGLETAREPRAVVSALDKSKTLLIANHIEHHLEDVIAPYRATRRKQRKVEAYIIRIQTVSRDSSSQGVVASVSIWMFKCPIPKVVFNASAILAVEASPG